MNYFDENDGLSQGLIGIVPYQSYDKSIWNLNFMHQLKYDKIENYLATYYYGNIDHMVIQIVTDHDKGYIKFGSWNPNLVKGEIKMFKTVNTRSLAIRTKNVYFNNR